jgi:alanine dehydrogenase
MIIGIPKEIRDNEFRVAMTPGGVRELTRHKHQVVIETGAGLGSGFTDNEYAQAGATVAHSASEVWNRAGIILKVKEPLPSEYPYLRSDMILFAYLHLVVNEDLTRAMINSGVSGIACETVEDKDGRLPLLQPVSEVAGRMATQIAAYYLQKSEGGRGILMGGIPGVRPAHVVILGAGTVGTNAAQIALGMGAQVTLLDINNERLRYLDEVLHGRLTTIYSNEGNITDALRTADALIGAVLITGARAPRLVTREMLSLMPRNSVIVDVSVDQGGCVETTRPTTHSDPTYVVDGVLHYGVPNMPGAVPRTSSLALVSSSLRYIMQVADLGLEAAVEHDPGFAKGLNVYRGRVTHPVIAESLGLPMSSI